MLGEILPLKRHLDGRSMLWQVTIWTRSCNCKAVTSFELVRASLENPTFSSLHLTLSTQISLQAIRRAHRVLVSSAQAHSQELIAVCSASAYRPGIGQVLQSETTRFPAKRRARTCRWRALGARSAVETFDQAIKCSRPRVV